MWVLAFKSAGLEGLTFHALRHANATAMVCLSVDVTTAQVRVGYAGYTRDETEIGPPRVPLPGPSTREVIEWG